MSQDEIWEERYRYLEETIEQICIGISKNPSFAVSYADSVHHLEVKREGEDKEFLVCIVQNSNVIYEFNLISCGQLAYSQRGHRNAVKLSKNIDRVLISIYEDSESTEPQFTKEVELNGHSSY